MLEKLLARLKFQTELQKDKITEFQTKRMKNRTKTISPNPDLLSRGHINAWTKI